MIDNDIYGSKGLNNTFDKNKTTAIRNFVELPQVKIVLFVALKF